LIVLHPGRAAFSDEVKAVSATPKVDGRRLRSERTKQAIIEAYLELLRESPLIPTAAQIAQRAGISVRSVFERFNDLNALSLATADFAIAQAQAESAARDVHADRAARIRSHVHTRAIACEKWLPLWRVLVTTQQELSELRQRVTLARLGNVARMRLMYGPELELLPERERERLLMVLGTVVSFESWDQMRHGYRLSIEECETAWREMFDRTLPGAS
jgi:AcrR family transcriptional regulator